MAKVRKIDCTIAWSLSVTEEELAEIALDTGIDGDEPTSDELDEAFETHCDKIEEAIRDGHLEIPEDANFDIAEATE